MVNAYKILKVSATATDDEIKASYRKLSIEYHPDHGGNADQMAALNEAYNLVNTPEKRYKYDSSNSFGSTFHQWESIFGKSNVAKNFGATPSKSRQNSRRGDDIDISVCIPLEMFVSGNPEYTLNYTKKMECLECSGTGIESRYKCGGCGGTGIVRTVTTDLKDKVDKCEKCSGTGWVVKNKCGVCGGNGFYEKNATYTFAYQPFMLLKSVIGKGCDGSGDGENGNLNITFIPTDDRIKYCNGSFSMEYGVHPEDFILGSTVDFLFGGKLIVYQLKPGTEYGKDVTIKNVGGSGMPLHIHFYPSDEINSGNNAIIEAYSAVRKARNEK